MFYERWLNMSHWCKFCGRTQPNEKFSGLGHKRHICRECARIPLEERQIIEQMAEIANFLDQSNISKQNMKRLKELASFANQEVSEQAQAVLEVALFQTHKRRRFKNMLQKRPDLIKKLGELGLISPWLKYENGVTFDFDDEYRDEPPDDIVEYEYMQEEAFDDEGEGEGEGFF
jgi:hypothetical protein